MATKLNQNKRGERTITDYNIPASYFESFGISTTEVSKVAPTDPDQDFYFEESEKGVPGSTVSFVYELKGPDLLERLQQAVDLLTMKNPALRSTFLKVEDIYYQVLLKTGNTGIVHHSEEMKEFLTQSVKRIIHPGDPVTQYALVQNHEKTFFVFSILHSFFDPFSRTILERDLLDALKSPDSFSQQAERLWYGEFVAHKQKTLEKQATSAFWATYLGNACLETFYEGKPKQRRTFDSSLRETLPNTLVQGRSIHIATAVFTAWSLTLMSESGQRDVAFAIAALGRLYPYEGIERTIGLFVRDRIFRLRATSTEVDIASLYGSVQEDLVSTGTQEHGKVAGILPGIDGAPAAQS